MPFRVYSWACVKLLAKKVCPVSRVEKASRSVALDDTKRTSVIFKVNDMRRC